MNIKEILRATGAFENENVELDEVLIGLATEQGKGEGFNGFVEFGFFCIVDSWNW